jgi:superfamily II DNA/RNA helicase
MSTEKENQLFENYELSKNLSYYDNFEDPELGLKDEILKGIYSYGFEKPSQIQRVAIKPIIDGKDIVVQSHSGTGKTATFIIGLLQRIDNELKETQCIIVSNTRELADQTYKVFKALSIYTKITCNLCIGGDMQYKYSSENIKEQVIIGTPGRISDLINKDIINNSQIKLIIIDEADDVLSTSFRKQVKTIFRKIPPEGQVVLISATIPEEMESLFNNIFKPDYLSILVKDDELTLDGITQYYIHLDEQYKVDALIDLYKFVSIGQAIVYCNKKNKADELKYILMEKSFAVSVLHGDMIQKEREEIMAEFRTGKTRILITTDILSRGIDIQQVSLVINYDMPKYPQTYIHRIGRSGRFGRKGSAINFVTKKERNILSFIQKMYNTEILPLPYNVADIL